LDSAAKKSSKPKEDSAERKRGQGGQQKKSSHEAKEKTDINRIREQPPRQISMSSRKKTRCRKRNQHPLVQKRFRGEEGMAEEENPHCKLIGYKKKLRGPDRGPWRKSVFHRLEEKKTRSQA